MEFSLVAIFPKGADLSKLEAAVKAAAEDKWGPDPKKWPKPLRSPFRKNEEMATKDEEGNVLKNDKGGLILPDGYEDGGFYIRVKSKQKPGLIDSNKEDIIDQSQFYAGCFARATVSAFAYDQKGNRGISLWLQNIQKLADGEPIGGRPKAQDEFEAIPELSSGSDSTSIFK